MIFNFKCSKCGRPTPIMPVHTSKIELCLDCCIEALNLMVVKFPAYRIFIEKWTQEKN